MSGVKFGFYFVIAVLYALNFDVLHGLIHFIVCSCKTQFLSKTYFIISISLYAGTDTCLILSEFSYCRYLGSHVLLNICQNTHT